MERTIPNSLRTWFVIHFAADMLFAIPLIIAPHWLMGLLGFTTVEPLTARLVGAALVGIGGTSLVIKKEGFEVFNALLILKILWSMTAIISIAISIAEGGPWSEWLLLVIFMSFSGLWIYYKISLGKG